jgi:hypothetical protein
MPPAHRRSHRAGARHRATFKSLGRKRTPQGKTVIARHLDDLDAAEARVNEIYLAWRTGEPTPPNGELDSMLSRWRALADGEELALRWPIRQPATADVKTPGARRHRLGHCHQPPHNTG